MFNLFLTITQSSNFLPPNPLPPCQLLKGHRSAVRTVDLSPDGQLIASGSIDRTIRLWDVAVDGRHD